MGKAIKSAALVLIPFIAAITIIFAIKGDTEIKPVEWLLNQVESIGNTQSIYEIAEPYLKELQKNLSSAMNYTGTFAEVVQFFGYLANFIASTAVFLYAAVVWLGQIFVTVGGIIGEIVV